MDSQAILHLLRIAVLVQYVWTLLATTVSPMEWRNRKRHPVLVIGHEFLFQVVLYIGGFYAFIGFPQIAYIVLTLIAIIIILVDKDFSEDHLSNRITVFITMLILYGIDLGLLYWGGFFG